MRSRREAHIVPSREEAIQEIMRLASMAAHEVAGPIDQISSLVALFERRYQGKLDADADVMLAHIGAARSRLARTAIGLRKCLQASTTGQRYVLVDMNEILRTAITSLRKVIADGHAELSAESLPSLAGDRDLLVLLMETLLDNALTFHEAGVPPRIEVLATSGPESHVIQVRDHGIGMEPQHSEDVFEPFRKLNGRVYPGAGFGLTLARTIVEMHGGKIWIEPADPGTCVLFELPVRTA